MQDRGALVVPAACPWRLGGPRRAFMYISCTGHSPHAHQGACSVCSNMFTVQAATVHNPERESTRPPSGTTTAVRATATGATQTPRDSARPAGTRAHDHSSHAKTADRRDDQEGSRPYQDTLYHISPQQVVGTPRSLTRRTPRAPHAAVCHKTKYLSRAPLTLEGKNLHL